MTEIDPPVASHEEIASGDEGGPPRIRGVGVDARGRCAHWRSERDIVSIRLPCCDGFWACHACHEEVADHPAERWAPESFEEEAILCGACGATHAIAGYLAGSGSCPRCGAGFNPRCALHHPLYFQVARAQ